MHYAVNVELHPARVVSVVINVMLYPARTTAECFGARNTKIVAQRPQPSNPLAKRSSKKSQGGSGQLALPGSNALAQIREKVRELWIAARWRLWTPQGVSALVHVCVCGVCVCVHARTHAHMCMRTRALGSLYKAVAACFTMDACSSVVMSIDIRLGHCDLFVDSKVCFMRIMAVLYICSTLTCMENESGHVLVSGLPK
eukprot:1159950-Pelagomonas_calceolata.AAC.5